MTPLSKAIHRVTLQPFMHYRQQIVITLIPGHGVRDDMIAMRLKGTRCPMLARVADVYRVIALWHGNKERIAKAKARKEGIPWRKAKRDFIKSNSIPT